MGNLATGNKTEKDESLLRFQNVSRFTVSFVKFANQKNEGLKSYERHTHFDDSIESENMESTILYISR